MNLLNILVNNIDSFLTSNVDQHRGEPWKKIKSGHCMALKLIVSKLCLLIYFNDEPIKQHYSSDYMLKVTDNCWKQKKGGCIFRTGSYGTIISPSR